MRKLILNTQIIFFCLTLYGQTKQMPHQKTEWLNLEYRMKTVLDNPLSHREFLDLGNDSFLKPTKKRKDSQGKIHTKHQQFYKGIPVEQAISVSHSINGETKLINGHIVRNLSINTQPSLDNKQVLKSALEYINADKYAWESDEMESLLKETKKSPNATFFPKGELVIHTSNLEVTTAKLAYRLEIYALSPLRRVKLFIDAHNGVILEEQDLILYGDVPCTGNTRYNATQNITCSISENSYYLKSEEKNIETRDGSLQIFADAGSPIELNSNNIIGSNLGEQDSIAISAQWGAEQWYEFFAQNVGWDSYDNQHSPIINFVHIRDNLGNHINNAYWDGTWAYYGDGLDGNSPWVSLDIIAHELSHGFIQSTAGLIYNGESGALNESFADIFAVMVERHALGDDGFNWTIGEDITNDNNGIRDMSEFREYGDSIWYSRTDDHGGVHTKSGVQNHWFYLLSQEIGIDSAAAICLFSLTNILTPLSGYHDMRNASYWAAKDLYGQATANLTCTIWNQVGVFGNCNDTYPITIISPPTNSGETLIMNKVTPIKWINNNSISAVNIQYTLPTGTGWVDIIQNFPVGGIGEIDSFSWLIPELGNNQTIYIRIHDSNDFARGSETVRYELQACPAVSSFIAEDNICLGNSTLLENTSSDAHSSSWIINGQNFSNNSNLTWIPPNAGTYNVLLQSVNENIGCFNNHSQNIHVAENSDEVVTFDYQKNGLEVVFTASYPDTIGNNYSWYLGDGTIDYGASISHSYQEEAIYEICLVVTNECGSFTLCKNIPLIASEGAIDLCKDQWNQYTNGNNVTTILDTDSLVWIGTSGGLVKYSKTDESKELYNNINSGIADNYVRSLIQDYQGNIWIGTTSGVSKYDGENWVNFHPSNSGLSLKLIRFILEDSNHNIWIGTQGGGLCRFDGVNWQVFDSQNSNLPHNDILVLLEDSNANIWAATNGGGIAKYNGTNWEMFNTNNSPLPTNKVVSFLEANPGEILMGTLGFGIVQYIDGNWVTYTEAVHGIPSDYTNSMIIDSAPGTYWTVGQEEGISHFNGIFWEKFNTSTSAIPSNFCTTILKDNNNNVWVGTRDLGIIKYNGQSWEHITPIDTEITNNGFTALAKDTSGVIWAAHNGGLTKIENEMLQTMDTSNSGIPAHDIRGLIASSNGYKWMVSYDAMVISYDEANNVWTQYDHNNSNLPNMPMTKIQEDSHGNIWVAISNSGLAKYDGQIWTVYNTGNSDLPHNSISGIMEDSSGKIWISTRGNGIALLNNGVWQDFFTSSNSGLPNNYVLHTIQDQNGYIWIATLGGVAKYDGTNWIVFNEANTDLPGNSISTLYEDSSGKIWVGVFGIGVSVYDDGNWQHMNAFDSGLPGDLITDFQEDDDGHIWIATYTGLGVLKPSLNIDFQTQISCAGDSSFFKNLSHFPQNTHWFIDGIEVSTEKDLHYYFDKSGDYEVILQTEDDENCTAIYKKWISIPAAAWELDENIPDTISACNGLGNSLSIDSELYTFADYQWYFEGILLDTTAIFSNINVEGTYYITVIDSCGATASDSIYILVGANAENCVWPGDTNNDGIANYKDLLSMGLSYNTIGNIRPNATSDWEGQPALDWGIGYGNVDNKHIDTNGDGGINYTDISALELNYGKTHNYTPPIQQEFPDDAPYTLKPKLELDSITGEVTLSIELDSNQTTPPPFYGFAFTIEYGNLQLDTSIILPSPQVDTIGDVLSISQYYPNQTEFAIISTNHQNNSQYAHSKNQDFIRQSIINFAIGIEFEIPGGDHISSLSVIPTEIIMLDNNGDSIDVNGESYTLHFNESSPNMAARTVENNKQKSFISNKDFQIKNHAKLFPNPTTQKEVFLDYYSTEEGILDIEFIDIYSHSILYLKEYIDKGKNQLTLNTSSLRNGIYFIKLSKNKHMEAIRLVVNNK